MAGPVVDIGWFKRYVAVHQEQLATFAVPLGAETPVDTPPAGSLDAARSTAESLPSGEEEQGEASQRDLHGVRQGDTRESKLDEVSAWSEGSRGGVAVGRVLETRHAEAPHRPIFPRRPQAKAQESLNTTS